MATGVSNWLQLLAKISIQKNPAEIGIFCSDFRIFPTGSGSEAAPTTFDRFLRKFAEKKSLDRYFGKRLADQFGQF